ncbi:hypothetical protein ACFX5K_01405 [Rickettsiales bacterium LUAb2]
MNMFKPIITIFVNILNIITSKKDLLDKSNKLLLTTKEIDDQNTKNSIHINFIRVMIEIVCLLGFTYSYLIVPIFNDIFSLHLQGLNNQNVLDSLLYALLGLGGYRLVEKVIKK